MVLLDYTSKTDSLTGLPFGRRMGQVTLVQPIQLDPNKKKKYQVIRTIISPEIPNVYNYGNFNNTQIRISNNGGISWSIIQFNNGIYQIDMIQDTITNAIAQAGWLGTSTTPIIVNYNPATQYVYIILNSSGIVGTQIAVDFGYTPFYNLLGFSTTSNAIFITDGTFSAQNPPQIDQQGTTCLIVCSLIQGCRYTNGIYSNIVARIPLVQSESQIEIVWPSASTGLLSPEVECSMSSTVMNYTVDIQTESGQSMVFLYGNFILELSVTDVD